MNLIKINHYKENETVDSRYLDSPEISHFIVFENLKFYFLDFTAKYCVIQQLFKSSIILQYLKQFGILSYFDFFFLDLKKIKTLTQCAL